MDNVQSVILGKAGTGKSVFSRWMILRHIKQHNKPVIVVDESLDHWKTLQKCGFKRVELNKNLAYKSFDWTALINEHRRIFVEVSGFMASETAYLMDDISQHVYNRGNLLLVVDEGHNFFGREEYSNEYARLWRSGRKRGIDLYLTTQMVVDLNIIATKQANVLISLQLTEENELKKISPYFSTVNGSKPIEFLPLFGVGDYVIKDMRRGNQQISNTSSLQGVKSLL